MFALPTAFCQIIFLIALGPTVMEKEEEEVAVAVMVVAVIVVAEVEKEHWRAGWTLGEEWRLGAER